MTPHAPPGPWGAAPSDRPAGTAFDHPADAAEWLRTRLGAGSPASAHCTLASDHRTLQPGDGFVAWPGRRHDARRFVPQALAAGAAACLVEAEGWDAIAAELGLAADDARIATLPGLKAAAGVVADRFFGQPSRQLQVLAVTGTNGKTSSCWWLAQALSALGRRCAVIGTLGVGEPPAAGRSDAAVGAAAGTALHALAGTGPDAAATEGFAATGLTTPDAVALHAALRRLADAGVAAVAIEASSIGLAEGRLAGLHLAVAGFTNLTPDHLDHHGTMDAYWAAKRMLFDWPALGAAVVNVDDARGLELAEALAARAAQPAPALWTVALHRPARLRGLNLRHGHGGLALDVQETAADGTALPPLRLATQVVGAYNAANLLGVLAALRALGLPLDLACAALAGVSAPPGRLERVAEGAADAAGAGGVEVVVDYAHTPDALEQVLLALRPRAAARGGRLWCVFGCGGNRDATKRPLMGAIAVRHADRVVITSDNPRDEPPALILAQILAGATGVGGPDEPAVIEDRREAIAHAIAHAAPGDVVLLAGKGHETTQEIAGVKRPFSDLDEARAALRARAAATAGGAA